MVGMEEVGIRTRVMERKLRNAGTLEAGEPLKGLPNNVDEDASGGIDGR